MNEAQIREKFEEWDEYGESDGAELKHITDNSLKMLYAAIMWDPEGVIQVGEHLLKNTKDPIAVLEAIQHAVGTIVEEGAEEHPDMDMKTVKAKAVDIKKKIQELQKAGKKSDVFATWKKGYDAKYEDEADDFANEDDE
ncbi:MAG: hypothetical protein ABL958_20610 [Bdellovibrionia bacterium]